MLSKFANLPQACLMSQKNIQESISTHSWDLFFKFCLPILFLAWSKVERIVKSVSSASEKSRKKQKVNKISKKIQISWTEVLIFLKRVNHTTPGSTLFSIKLEDRQCNGGKYGCTQVSLMLCFLSFSWLMNHEEDKKMLPTCPQFRSLPFLIIERRIHTPRKSCIQSKVRKNH